MHGGYLAAVNVVNTCLRVLCGATDTSISLFAAVVSIILHFQKHRCRCSFFPPQTVRHCALW